jgi:DNA repair exonuclease SbcCD ATPase subunit
VNFDLNTALNVRLALVFLGGALLLTVALAAWIHAQFLKPPVEDLQKRLRDFELATAAQAGKDLPERVSKLEDRNRQLELDVNTLKTSETQRSVQLTRGLEELAELVDQLKEDMRRGDIDSRVDSAEALVSSIRVAVTLAKLQSQEARDRANEQLNEALAALEKLRIEQRKAAGAA